MTISAKMVQELRERTGAPLMDCKRALSSTSGDLEAAIDQLRKAGLKSAEKRVGRSTAEGRVRSWISPDGRAGGMVALTSETDFVARTEDFTKLALTLAEHVAKRGIGDVDALLGSELAGGKAVGETIKEMSGKMGENMQVLKVARLENHKGRVGAYVHFNDKIGALVSVTSSKGAGEIDAFIKDLGMHVAASKPIALTRAELPAEEVARERAVFLESEDVLSKPEDKRERIVQGKLEKYFAGAVLLEQPWVKDPALSVTKALEAALGKDARIEAFSLFAVGA